MIQHISLDFGSTFGASWLHFGSPGLHFWSIFITFLVWGESLFFFLFPFVFLMFFGICGAPHTFFRDWQLLLFNIVGVVLDV